jgi:MFS family permease
MHSNHKNDTYKWYILALAALTNTMVVALPTMSMSVLFKEISVNLNFDLVQVGLIWGIGSLPGIVTGLLGGAIGDRFGPKRILILSCLLVGLAGGLRGMANNFYTLFAAVFLFGFLTPIVTMNVFKTCGIWFLRAQLGLANGVLSMGMALGFLLGSLISATYLSPLLAGWRNVLFVYGGLAAAVSIPWFFSRSLPEQVSGSAILTYQASIWQAISHVAKIGKLWLFGLALLGISGCVQGVLGYLPLYLRGVGWPEASADGALAAFHTLSLIFVIPIALWSDKLGARKKILIPAALLALAGVSLLSVAQGSVVWGAVALAGLVRDGFMAVFITMIIETEGVGPVYAGTATGFVLIFSGLGNLIAPPIGNSLAVISPSTPFIFWACLTAAGLICIYLTKESRLPVEARMVPQPSD